ncbi:hypothetical protein ACLQ2S_25105 [Micromonospora sp. DT48]|uniref:hypothetical protein n=1 Tax=unclassified Micromonospora TaxID=2617518 RepID=UPI0012BC8D77|nr:hypothetical protein [Micromonospora sp. CP22]MTK05442.1 hypothetical protein [Micromonospora sp. CP22]
MKNAVFLVKNGIGFGHIRRALLIAEAVQSAGRLRPIVISQASSLALYRNSPVRVVNFPLLHRVPSAVAEDLYTDLLDRLLSRLDPVVVVEDTYPDARYRRLPALADRPRLLVMRRLDGLSFDQIRQRGDFGHYDEILVAQDEHAFHEEGHSGESLAAVELSGRFRFVGNIAHIANGEEVIAARMAYAPDGAPLVVVNGGAGGDQMPDGYGDRLFTACQDVAAALAAEGNPARFVLVTGPYYAGRPLQESENVTVRRFDPRLPALLAAGDVVVIKPGNNALSEALAGGGQLVLVPDVSFMEGLDEHAARVAQRYGGVVGTPDRNSLEPLIRSALARGPRPARLAPRPTALAAVVDAIHDYAGFAPGCDVSPKLLLLALIAPDYLEPAELRKQLPDSLREAVIVDSLEQDEPLVRLTSLDRTSFKAVAAVVVDGEVGPMTPQQLAERGVRLLIRTGASPAVDRWLRLHPSRPALLAQQAELVRASPRPEALKRRATKLLNAGAAGTILVDLRALPPLALADYLTAVGQWIARQPVRVVGVSAIVAQEAERLLERRPDAQST